MSGQRLVFVLLAVVALIFAAVVWMGAGHGGSPGQPAWATVVRDWFVQEQPLQPRDVKGPCVSGGRTIVLRPGPGPGPGCTVTIARREDALIRNMVLELSDIGKVRGTLKPAGDTAGPVSITLQPKARTLKLPIVEDGATLDLTCANANPVSLVCMVAIR